FTDEENAFRAEVRQFFRDHVPDSVRQKLIDGEMVGKDELVAWSRLLDQKGWAAAHWPPEYGGTGWDPMRQYIFLEEMQKYPAPQPLAFGVNMVGPVIYTFGNAAQKERFLPAIRNLDDWWCQG
ncbi:acyl-CoA dehydrogenase family protein, partial [Rhizobiaceae sp. 2RAB30]